MAKMDEALNEIAHLSHEIDDGHEQRELRRAIVDLVSSSHVAITMKIVQQFPDLHSDKKLPQTGA
jgi:hypothetical protein